MKSFRRCGARRALAVLAALSYVACSGGGVAPGRDAAGAQTAAPGQASRQQPSPSQSAQNPRASAAEKVYRGAIAGRGIELRLARDGERLT
ncbi:MAG: hypothetical protein LC800_09325, partial [Acidobacteria bacterium]|nr:hypothetical protein [Acidobacteriota bacterium]